MNFQEMRYSTYHEVISWELRHAVRRYYEEWENIMCLEAASRSMHTVPIEQKRLAVILLSSCLIESVINFVISVHTNADDFEKLHWKRVHYKWTEVLKRFYPNYALPPDLESQLKELIARRNATVHPKPAISIDGDNRHTGNEPDVKLDEHEFVRRCAMLPSLLIDNLEACSPAPDVFMMTGDLRYACAGVLREIRRGDFRVAAYTDLPEPLIIEIMSQGHDRKAAIQFAAQIRNFRDRDKEGNILVRATRKETVRLKPLVFFDRNASANV
jgi:hypothetical protein